LVLKGVRLGGGLRLRTINGTISYGGGGGTGGSVTTVNGGVSRALQPPATGHYTLLLPSGARAWPAAGGPALGQIVLGAANGQVTVTQAAASGGSAA
jgi:hypothetical protein